MCKTGDYSPLIDLLLIKHKEVLHYMCLQPLLKWHLCTSKLYSTESYSPGLCSWQRRNIFRFNKVDLDVLDSFLYKTIRRPEVWGRPGHALCSEKLGNLLKKNPKIRKGPKICLQNIQLYADLASDWSISQVVAAG